MKRHFHCDMVRRKTHLDQLGWIMGFALPTFSAQERTLAESAGWPPLDSGPEFIKTFFFFAFPFYEYTDYPSSPVVDHWKFLSQECRPELHYHRTEYTDLAGFHLFFRCEIFLNILWRLDENFPMLLLLSECWTRVRTVCFVNFARRLGESWPGRMVQWISNHLFTTDFNKRFHEIYFVSFFSNSGDEGAIRYEFPRKGQGNIEHLRNCDNTRQ